MAGSTSETVLYDILMKMTTDSIEASDLDPATLMLTRIARSSRLMLLRFRTC